MLLLVFGLLLPACAFSDSRLVPEDVLAEWGYETTDLEKYQIIRRIEALPDREERWHPKFNVWSECFDSNDDALSRMRSKEAEIESEPSMIYKSAVGMLVRDQCVYFVLAHGTFFMLEYQPFIMRKLEQYLCTDRECTRSTLMDDL
jgi:hypothetical protein